jgi:hypothetical protein
MSQYRAGEQTADLVAGNSAGRMPAYQTASKAGCSISGQVSGQVLGRLGWPGSFPMGVNRTGAEHSAAFNAVGQAFDKAFAEFSPGAP